MRKIVLALGLALAGCSASNTATSSRGSGSGAVGASGSSAASSSSGPSSSSGSASASASSTGSASSSSSTASSSSSSGSASSSSTASSSSAGSSSSSSGASSSSSSGSGSSSGSSGTFFATGLGGAGFQNVVSVGNGYVLAGADVAGFNRSTDDGAHFTPSNLGFTQTSFLGVAAILQDPGDPQTLYAGVGKGFSSGALLVTHDQGQHWSTLSSSIQFNGGNVKLPDGGALTGSSEHPRSTGNLLAIDTSTSPATLYAATFNDGLVRIKADGTGQTTLGLQGKYLRTVAMDPSDPTTLYVGAFNDRVYKVSQANGSATIQGLAASPPYPEELLALGSRLYLAAGPDGIFVSHDGGGDWASLNAGTIPTGTSPSDTDWMSIAGYQSGGSDHLFVGCDFPVGNVSVYKSGNGGQSWTASLTKTSADPTMIGTSATWWMALASGSSGNLPGNGGYVAADLFVASSGEIWSAGRGGLWRSTDDGATWNPALADLGVTVNNAVVADPNRPGTVYVGNTDWTFLGSTDSMATVRRNHPSGAASVGYAIALDTSQTPSGVYVATGNRDTNTEGEVFFNADPAASSTWTNLGLGASSAGGSRPLGLAVGYDASGKRVVLAAVEDSGPGGTNGNGGVYRRVGSGSFTRVATAAMTTSTTGWKNAAMLWLPGTQTVFLFDHDTGLWRSTDAGATWTELWAQPSTQGETGVLAWSASTPHALFASADDGVHQLDNADTGAAVGNGITQTTLGSLSSVGPIGFDASGRLWAASLLTSTSPPRFSRWSGTSWVDAADDFYRGAGGVTGQFAFDASGMVFVALKGNGVIRGRP